jgi:hypothetical protein
MGKCEKAAAWLVWWAMCDRVGWWARKKAHGREASEKGNRTCGDQNCMSLHHFKFARIAIKIA